MISKSTIDQVLGIEWSVRLFMEFNKPYMQKVSTLVQKRRNKGRVYPHSKDVFYAYKLTPFDDVKVCVLGMDPYINPNQAHGLAFSVGSDYQATPPSLQNIFKEVEKDSGFDVVQSNNLTRWAKQGVFLLNSVLTADAGKSGSHKDFGWQKFTGKTIKLLAERSSPIVFMLWGKYAESYAPLIRPNTQHLILTASHPSPFSYRLSFEDCRHFHLANEFLKDNNKQPIDWNANNTH